MCIYLALCRPPLTDISSPANPRASSLHQGGNNPSFLAEPQVKQLALFRIWAAVKMVFLDTGIILRAPDAHTPRGMGNLRLPEKTS